MFSPANGDGIAAKLLDYDLAATLAKLAKTAAPGVRIAISEQPRPEIAENVLAGGKSYDLWWAELRDYEPRYAQTRQALGEKMWWYFLSAPPPYFNPVIVNHPGVETRLDSGHRFFLVHIRNHFPYEHLAKLYAA